MDFDKDFADPDLENQGVWVDFEDDDGNPIEEDVVQVKIGRLGNPTFNDKFEKLMKPHREMQRRGKLSADKQTDILCRAYIGTVLFDWKGFTTHGEHQPWDEAYALKMLVGRTDFRNTVTRLAARSASFKRDFDEDSEKNLSPPSDGGSTTATAKNKRNS